MSSPPPPPQSVNNILSPLDGASPQPVQKSWYPNSNNRGDSTPHGIKSNAIATGNGEGIENDCFSSLSCCVTPASEMRLCPLPALSWAEAKDVWKFMCRKDEKASLERDSSMLSNHPGWFAGYYSIYIRQFCTSFLSYRYA